MSNTRKLKTPDARARRESRRAAQTQFEHEQLHYHQADVESGAAGPEDVVMERVGTDDFALQWSEHLGWSDPYADPSSDVMGAVKAMERATAVAGMNITDFARAVSRVGAAFRVPIVPS